MPALSEKRKKYMEWLNRQPSVIATQFKQGRTPHNKKRIHTKELCPDCNMNMKGIYYERCRSCAYRRRKESQSSRIWKNGYEYVEGGSKPRPEHMRIAEKVLGRALTSKEVVHHVNMIRTDNRNGNLLICSNKYHAWLHGQYARRFAERYFDAQ